MEFGSLTSPLIMTGFGNIFFCPSTYGLKSCTLLTLITGCILIDLGSSNSITLLEMIPLTL